MYSRWLQVPVSIERDLFAAILEWGTKVRGRYEIVLPPQLIVMSWDFDDGNIPVPGHPFPLRRRSPWLALVLGLQWQLKAGLACDQTGLEPRTSARLAIATTQSRATR